MNLFSLFAHSFLYYAIIVSTFLANTANSSSTLSSANTQQMFHSSNPIVRASPLCAAAVCSDGVVMVGLHPAHQIEHLLDRKYFLENEENSLDKRVRHDFGFRLFQSKNKMQSRMFNVDSEGKLILLSSGWKADCSIFTKKCRSIWTELISKYGEGDIIPLVHEAATWLTKCDFLDSLRSMGCAGLVAGYNNDKTEETFLLYLVCAAGYHRLRACAIGQGSSHVNKLLSRINFDDLPYEEAAYELLHAIHEALSKDENGISCSDLFVEMHILQNRRT